jgi:hypothetical protein
MREKEMVLFGIGRRRTRQQDYWEKETQDTHDWILKIKVFVGFQL